MAGTWNSSRMRAPAAEKDRLGYQCIFEVFYGHTGSDIDIFLVFRML